jgi:hypothetical protein
MMLTTIMMITMMMMMVMMMMMMMMTTMTTMMMMMTMMMIDDKDDDNTNDDNDDDNQTYDDDDANSDNVDDDDNNDIVDDDNNAVTDANSDDDANENFTLQHTCDLGPTMLAMSTRFPSPLSFFSSRRSFCSSACLPSRPSLHRKHFYTFCKSRIFSLYFLNRSQSLRPAEVAGHIILTPVNQLSVTGQTIW